MTNKELRQKVHIIKQIELWAKEAGQKAECFSKRQNAIAENRWEATLEAYKKVIELLENNGFNLA